MGSVERPEYPDLSPTDLVLLRQACRLIARSERCAKANEAIRLSSESRRILRELRAGVRAKAAGREVRTRAFFSKGDYFGWAVARCLIPGERVVERRAHVTPEVT